MSLFILLFAALLATAPIPKGKAIQPVKPDLSVVDDVQIDTCNVRELMITLLTYLDIFDDFRANSNEKNLELVSYAHYRLQEVAAPCRPR